MRKQIRRKIPAPRMRSSSTETHSYDPESSQLTVTFRGGRQYRYDGVDQKTVDDLDDSSSKGAFIQANIVNRFPTTKL